MIIDFIKTLSKIYFRKNSFDLGLVVNCKSVIYDHIFPNMNSVNILFYPEK